MIKVTCTYAHDGSVHVVYLDEDLAFPPQNTLPDKNMLHEKIKKIAATFVNKHSSNQGLSKTYIHHIEEKADAANIYTLSFTEGIESNADYTINTEETFPNLSTLHVELVQETGANNNITKEIESDEKFYENIVILARRTLTQTKKRIEESKDIPTLIDEAPKPVLLELVKGYTYNRKAADELFNLDWNTHFKKLDTAVNNRRYTHLRPLEESLSAFKKEIAELESNAKQVTDNYDYEEFAAYTASKIAELDLENTLKPIETTIAIEKARLNNAGSSALDRELEIHHRIYSDAQATLRYFNMLLAWHLYRGAKKYWENILSSSKETLEQKAASFNEKFGCIGIQVNGKHLTSINSIYNVFCDATPLTFDQTQERIQQLLKNCNKRLLGWASGLTEVQDALVAFDEECRGKTEASFNFGQYRECVKQPLFTAYFRGARSYLPTQTNKETFYWNSNAKEIGNIVQSIINADYKTQITKKFVDDVQAPKQDSLAPADRLCEPLLQDINENEAANKALTEANRALTHLDIKFNGAPRNQLRRSDDSPRKKAPPRVINLSNSADPLPGEPIRKQIEVKRADLILRRLKENGHKFYVDGLISKENAERLYQEILKLPETENTAEYRERAFDLHRKLAPLFDLLKTLHEKIESADKPSTISDTPARMNHECTAQLKNIASELIAIKVKLSASTQVEEPKREPTPVVATKAPTPPPPVLAPRAPTPKLPVDAEEEVQNARILGRCRDLVGILVRNLGYWESKIRFWGGDEVVYGEEKAVVPKGIAAMINAIKSHNGYEDDLETAKSLLSVLKSKAAEATKRLRSSSCKYNFFSIRDDEVNNFYNLLSKDVNGSCLDKIRSWRDNLKKEQKSSRCCC